MNNRTEKRDARIEAKLFLCFGKTRKLLRNAKTDDPDNFAERSTMHYFIVERQQFHICLE